MSATNAPFGLRPAFHPSGLDRAQALANGIASGYNTDILKGQPVKYVTGGVINVAAAGDSLLALSLVSSGLTPLVVVACRTTGLPTRHTRLVHALPTSTTIQN